MLSFVLTCTLVYCTVNMIDVCNKLLMNRFVLLAYVHALVKQNLSSYMVHTHVCMYN